MRQGLYILLACTVLLSGCGLYTKYERPADIQTENLFRDIPDNGEDLISLADLSWDQFFTDPQLQAYIAEGLANNTDLQNALLTVEQAEAILLPAKLAFFPSLALAPQGTISSFDGGKASFNYQLPAVASWQLDLFGGLLNAKRGAKASLLQSQAYRQAVQARVVTGIATCYYSLLMLHAQFVIASETATKWQENVATMKAMKEAAMTNEAGVAQSEAAYYQVLLSIPELRRSIREVENTLNLLLGRAPEEIVRGRDITAQQLPTEITVGLPAKILARRPDVQAAEYSLMSAYYGTKQAQAAFYPGITLSGTAAFTNNAGGITFNPAKFVASAVGSLTQPIFMNGALRAQSKIAKASQEQAKNNFEQTLLNAGTEVSNALFQYQTALEKQAIRSMQVESTRRAAEFTKYLFTFPAGNNTSYLEVLNAEQTLLQARLAEVSDHFERLTALITLYQAVGGGTN